MSPSAGSWEKLMNLKPQTSWHPNALVFSAFLFCAVLGCSNGPEQSAINILGTEESRFAEVDVETWVTPMRTFEPGATESRYDLHILTPRHFAVIVLDGERLREYFLKRSLDIDQALLGEAAKEISLKHLRSLILAFDSHLANNVLAPESPRQGWLVQLDFATEVNQEKWNQWLLGGAAAETKKTSAGHLLAPGGTHALHWTSATQLLVAMEDEFKIIASGSSENGQSELAADILQQEGSSLAYLALRAAPLQQLVEDVSGLVASSGFMNSDMQSMLDAVRGLDKFQVHADLQNEDMVHFELSFLDQTTAKSVLTMVTQNIDQMLAQGPISNALLNTARRNSAGNAPGLGNELQKLLSEIQSEMALGGLESVAEGRVVHIRAKRPGRLDELIDQGLAGLADTYSELSKQERLRKLGRALQAFYRDNGRYPAESASPLIYQAAKKMIEDTEAEVDPALPPFSWRVALLPYLDHSELYEAFDFTEPWNSDANKTAAAKMPDVFDWRAATTGTLPLVTNPDRSVPMSNLQFLTGIAGAMGKKGITQAEQVIDGVDRTLMLAEVPMVKTPWSAPGGWEVASQQDLASWIQSSEQSVIAMFFSGRVIAIPRQASLENLFGMVTPDGKERSNRTALVEMTLLPPLPEE